MSRFCASLVQFIVPGFSIGRGRSGCRLPWLLLILATGSAEAASPLAGREVLSLDWGWRFHFGDIPATDFRANGDEAQGGGKGASAWGAAAPGYDHQSWAQVDLPHDWVVEQAFDPKAVRNQGYRPRGMAWYRRQFKLPQEDQGKQLELQFDGVSTHCQIWFNGALVGRNWNGYTSIYVDISALARYGDEPNTIAVRDDATAMEGWWYEGGGIYRHTWLVKRSPVHIVTDGVYANPVKSAGGQWSIPIEASLQNSSTNASVADVEVKVLDPAGRQVASGRARKKLEPWAKATVGVRLKVRNPQLWSTSSPTLYTVSTKVSSNGQTDETLTQCGFRTLRFDAERGFFLNGKPLKIQGVCCHQDHAGVGVAVPDSLLERKLQEMGTNAYRTAHHPPSKELLDACDRLGMLVMDETRHFSSSAEGLRQLEWLVRRDRNRPSVILLSLFNEENDLQGTDRGRAIVQRMMAVVRSLDTTRLITGGQNGGQLVDGKLNPQSVSRDLDVVGVNYQVDLYDMIREAHPGKPILSTEDGSQVMTRGVFFTDWQKLALASYDDKYPGWTAENRGTWEAIARQPAFAGGFIWTGFDYRGEPSPFGWPAVNSYFGCLDLCGFPKTGFYLRQAMWVRDRPVLSLIPHWNWAGREGQPIRVMAMSNAKNVELFLNGKSLGEKPVDPFRMVEWQVPYAPGRLEAVARSDGKELKRAAVETTGEPVALRLVPDRSSLAGDGRDAVPVTVEAVDAEGRSVPTANLAVEFEISGSGAIIGLGNGDPTSHEPEKGTRRSLFNGLAQVILQSRRGGSGSLVLRAKASGVSAAETRINVKAAAPLPAVD